MMRDTFLSRRKLFGKLLSEIEGVEINKPDGAFYMFPRISYFFGKKAGEIRITNSDDLAEYILTEAHVATVSGDAFGSPDCLRLSYAASEKDLQEAARRMQKALAKLQ